MRHTSNASPAKRPFVDADAVRGPQRFHQRSSGLQLQRIGRAEGSVCQQRDLINDIFKKLRGLQQTSLTDDKRSTGSVETVTDAEMPERREFKETLDEPHQESLGPSRTRRRK